jgi:prophage regulatory protein
VGWPEYEVEALNAARIAGKTGEEIRRLVKKLEAARHSAVERGYEPNV